MDLPFEDLGSMDLDLTGDSELDISLARGLGVDSLDSIDFDTGDDLELDLSDSSGAIEASEAILLKSSVDVVAQLIPYSELVREALLINKSKLNQTVDGDMLLITNDEFPYVDAEVFSTFYRVFSDLCTDPAYSKLTDEECANEALDLMLEATGWGPGLYHPEYMRDFARWRQKFGRLAGTTSEHYVNSKELISLKELEEAVDFYNLNTSAFVNVTNFMSDEVNVRTRSLIDHKSLGDFTEDYMQSHGLTQFTMSDAYDCVLGYFGSEDMAVQLGVTREELVGYSVGEVLRRILLYELTSGIMYPTGLKVRPAPDFQLVYGALVTCMQSGSVAAEVTLLIATMMVVSGGNGSKREQKTALDTMQRFLNDIHLYLLAATGEPFKVNPVFYGRVSEGDNGDYLLTYVVNDQTKTVHSNTVLCDVFGDRTRTYCIPRIIMDVVNECTVCPPVGLVTPLRSVQTSGRLKVSGDVSFVFQPTLHWLAANHILVDERAEEVSTSEVLTLSGNTSNPLLNTLLNYDNRFVDSGEIVKPVVVAADSCLLYSVSKTIPGVAPELYRLYSITDVDGNSVGSSGSMVVDKETGNLIVSFIGSNGQTVEGVYESGQYSEEYIDSAVDTGEKQWGLADFVPAAQKYKPVDYVAYRGAVRELCSLTAFDYEAELSEARILVARDLYYVLGLSAIDELLASSMLEVYSKYIEDTGGVDNFNMPYMSELFDILCGEQSAFHGVAAWSGGCKDVFAKLAPTVRVTVDDVCKRIDSLDTDLLAVHALCHGEANREYDMCAYNALCYIPEIGSRLAIIEDNIVAMRVIDAEGPNIVNIFTKRSFLTKAWKAQLTARNVDAVSNQLGTAGKLKGVDVLRVTKRVLTAKPKATDALLRYFVLDRNMFAILDTVRCGGEPYAGLYSTLVKELGLEELDVASLTPVTFRHAVSGERVSRVHLNHREELNRIAEDGLITEIVNNNWVQTIKAYDIFRAFHASLTQKATARVVQVEDYEEEFLKYAGSFVISYCPVVDTSCSEIDGGDTRVMAFVKEYTNFIYKVPIEFLKDYDLQDLKVIVDW